TATQDAVAELTAHLERLRQQRDGATAAVTETKVTLASQEQLCASFRQQQQPLEQRIRELANLGEQRRAEIGIFATRKTQWETEIEESRRQIERLRDERKVVSEQTAALIADREA